MVATVDSAADTKPSTDICHYVSKINKFEPLTDTGQSECQYTSASGLYYSGGIGSISAARLVKLLLSARLEGRVSIFSPQNRTVQ